MNTDISPEGVAELRAALHAEQIAHSQAMQHAADLKRTLAWALQRIDEGNRGEYWDRARALVDDGAFAMGKLIGERERLRLVAECLCKTIEATGGISRNPDGTYSPEGDPEWIDLADAYLAACGALDRKPMVGTP